MPTDLRPEIPHTRIYPDPTRWRVVRPNPDLNPTPVVTPRSAALWALEAKWNALGGAPGQAIAELTLSDDGYQRAYEHGTMYGKPGEAPLYVHGAIGNRYTELGGTSSWLGWPTSDEEPFPQEGRITSFDHGNIHWWPDTGAIDLADVVVRYSGLFCWGETDWDQASAADEPYVYFGVVGPDGVAAPIVQSRIYEDGVGEDPGVDQRETVIDSIELYRGRPYGIGVAVTMFEHDFGDPNRFLGTVDGGVKNAARAVSAAVAPIPLIGGAIALAIQGLVALFGDDLVAAINDLLGTEDDYLGTVNMHLTAKQMVVGARAPAKRHFGIEFDEHSPMITGHGGAYMVFAAIDEA